MKTVICPQCGHLIRHLLPHQPIAECEHCGAEVVTDQTSGSPVTFAAEAAKFRAPARFARSSAPVKPLFIVISGIGIFIILIFFILFIQLKTSSAVSSPPEPSKPVFFPVPSLRKSVGDADRPPPLDSLKIPTVSYCDLIKNAADYDKKIVRVRAVYFSGFEQIYLYDERCESNQPPAAPEKVPAETWAEGDKSLITKGDSDEAKLNRRLNGFGRKDITVVGKFHSSNEQGDSNAPNLFGHMNCCRFQFSIMRAENVVEMGEENNQK